MGEPRPSPSLRQGFSHHTPPARPNNCASGRVVAHLNPAEPAAGHHEAAHVRLPQVTIAARFIADQEPRLEQIITS